MMMCGEGGSGHLLAHSSLGGVMNTCLMCVHSSLGGEGCVSCLMFAHSSLGGGRGAQVQGLRPPSWLLLHPPSSYNRDGVSSSSSSSTPYSAPPTCNLRHPPGPSPHQIHTHMPHPGTRTHATSHSTLPHPGTWTHAPSHQTLPHPARIFSSSSQFTGHMTHRESMTHHGSPVSDKGCHQSI